MKKMLSLLTVTTLATTAGATTIACGNHDHTKEKAEMTAINNWKEILKKTIENAEYANKIYNWETKDKFSLVDEINKAKKTLNKNNPTLNEIEAAQLQLKWQVEKFLMKNSKSKDEIKAMARILAWATKLYNKGLNTEKIENNELTKLYKAIKEAEKNYNNMEIIKNITTIEKACNEFSKNTGIKIE